MTADKTLLKAVRVVLDDQLVQSGRSLVGTPPSADELLEAHARLAKMNGVDILLLLRSNRSYFADRVFEGC